MASGRNIRCSKPPGGAADRAGAGGPANGKACRQFVEFVDLVPTLGELVKLDLPKNLEGTKACALAGQSRAVVEEDRRSWWTVTEAKWCETGSTAIWN